MMEILLFVLLGIVLGILFGLIPGLHPNMVILLVPLIAQINIAPLPLIAFVVSLGVSNTFLDFIPSMLLGAAEAGKELAVLPSHKMLLAGSGYDAIKLAVVGGLGSIIFVAVSLPAIIFAIPNVYNASRPFTYALLVFIILIMVLSENTTKARLSAAVCFVLAGMIGITSASLPIDRNLVLFPILSGLFGVSMLVLSSNQKIKLPKRRKEIRVSGRLQRRSITFGSLGGIISGLLPGVGSSEIASLASIDKNEKSFIMTLGAITISNTLLSIMALWLIQKSRSGIATVLDQLVTIGFNEFLFIVAVALFVSGISAIITLRLTKKSLDIIEKVINGAISKVVVAFIFAMTIIFTGIYGLLLLFTCTMLGIFTNLCGVRRSVLMGVLILPTILFYLPIYS